MQCERYDEALPLLHKAYYLDEQSQQVKEMLAWCLIVNRQDADASRHILELLQADAMNEEANLLLGIIMIMDGRIKESYTQLLPYRSDSNFENLSKKLDVLCRHRQLDYTKGTLLMDALKLQIN